MKHFAVVTDFDLIRIKIGNVCGDNMSPWACGKRGRWRHFRWEENLRRGCGRGKGRRWVGEPPEEVCLVESAWGHSGGSISHSQELPLGGLYQLDVGRRLGVVTAMSKQHIRVAGSGLHWTEQGRFFPHFLEHQRWVDCALLEIICWRLRQWLFIPHHWLMTLCMQ